MRTMTIKDYIHNPAGIGAAAIPNRELVRNDLIQRFQKLYSEKRDLFLGNVYKSNGDYFIHVVIPSEGKDKKNTYDVVIKFDDNHRGDRKSSTVEDYNIQVFSNSPSFTFTYAYVFNKESLLVPELKNKFNDETFQPPTTRNPYESISYEKTTFMAIQFILNNPELMTKSVLDKGGSMSNLKTVVRNTDKIKIENTIEKNRLSELARSEKVGAAKAQKVKDSATTKKTEPKRGITRITAKKAGSKTRPKAKVGPTISSRKK